MKLQAALQGVSSIYLDTSPVIYYVEAVPEFSTVIDPIFGQIESGILSQYSGQFLGRVEGKGSTV